jgi:hypothetical protein
MGKRMKFLVLLAIGLGVPSLAVTAQSHSELKQQRNKEYFAFQESTVGRRIFLLLSDGNRRRAIRLCECECRLKALDALDIARELALVCRRAPAGTCDPADGSFLEYALYANKAEMAQWLADDSISEAKRFEEVRPYLERAIEMAGHLEYDYAVPQAFEQAYPFGSYHPLVQARLTYADAMLDCR